MRDDFERNRGVTDLVGLVSSCLVGGGVKLVSRLGKLEEYSLM